MVDSGLWRLMHAKARSWYAPTPQCACSSCNQLSCHGESCSGCPCVACASLTEAGVQVEEVKPAPCLRPVLLTPTYTAAQPRKLRQGAAQDVHL